MAEIEGRSNWPIVTGPLTNQQFIIYTTRYGDSLSSLARRFLGDSDRWQEIYKANAGLIKHPDRLDENFTLRIPVVAGTPGARVARVARHHATPPPKPLPVHLPTGESCEVKPVQQGIPAATICFTTYTVREGESLSGIAQKLWQDQSRWEDLYRANLEIISDPELLPPNTVLKVPDDEEIKALRAAPLAHIEQRKPLPKEREMLARAVLAEARGESRDTQMAVATAIRNYAIANAVSIPRLVRSSFLSSNYDDNGRYFTMPVHKIDPKEWQNGLAAAEDAFKPDGRGRQLIGNRDHFYDDSIRMPSWGKKSTRVKIGAMYFLKER